jgi:hypothetical protein
VHLFLDICQGLGLGAAAGLRPFLPAVAAGLFATVDWGVDFEGTSFAFLESPVWIGCVIALMILSFLIRSTGGEGPTDAAIGGVGIGLGGLLFAGTLADHGYTAWPGLIAGVVCAALGHFAVRSLFERVRARVEQAVKDALVAYQDFASFAGALLAILVPPVSILLLGFLGWLLLGGRRRAGEKFAGLRILR